MVDVGDVVVVLCDVVSLRMVLWSVVEILSGETWFSCPAVGLFWP